MKALSAKDGFQDMLSSLPPMPPFVSSKMATDLGHFLTFMRQQSLQGLWVVEQTGGGES